MRTIIEMAREANAMHNIIEEWVTFDYTELERFAELVRADEREACVAVVEGLFDDPNDAVLECIVDAMQARGTHDQRRSTHKSEGRSPDAGA